MTTFKKLSLVTAISCVGFSATHAIAQQPAIAPTQNSQYLQCGPNGCFINPNQQLTNPGYPSVQTPNHNQLDLNYVVNRDWNNVYNQQPGSNLNNSARFQNGVAQPQWIQNGPQHNRSSIPGTNDNRPAYLQPNQLPGGMNPSHNYDRQFNQGGYPQPTNNYAPNNDRSLNSPDFRVRDRNRDQYSPGLNPQTPVHPLPQIPTYNDPRFNHQFTNSNNAPFMNVDWRQLNNNNL